MFNQQPPKQGYHVLVLSALFILLSNDVVIVPPAKMFRQHFWMRAMDHPTPKRTILFSNTAWISEFSFAARLQKALLVGNISTTDKYVCKKTGKTRFKGNGNLKGTQLLGKCLFFLLWGFQIQATKGTLYTSIKGTVMLERTPPKPWFVPL